MRVTVLSFLEEYTEVIESCRNVTEAVAAAATGGETVVGIDVVFVVVV